MLHWYTFRRLFTPKPFKTLRKALSCADIPVKFHVPLITMGNAGAAFTAIASDERSVYVVRLKYSDGHVSPQPWFLIPAPIAYGTTVRQPFRMRGNLAAIITLRHLCSTQLLEGVYPSMP